IVLKIFPFEFVAGIKNAFARWKIFPFIYQLSPVGEAPDFIHRLWRLVFAIHPLEESGVHVLGGYAGGEGLVVDLIRDYGRVVFKVADNLPNHLFRVLAKVGIEEVVILSRAISAGWS